MGEIIVYLLQQAGPPILFIAFGFVADQVSSPKLKEAVVSWISREYFPTATPKRLRRFLKLFLDGFIHRIFGRRLFSLSFLKASCLLSIIFFILALSLQFIYYPALVSDQFRIISYRPVEASFFFGAILFINFGVDYLSNVLTISFLRMAMFSGRVLDTIIVFVADITLTITIFTFVFPIGVTLAAIVNQGDREKGTLEIITPSKWAIGAAEDRHKKKLAEISEKLHQAWDVQIVELACTRFRRHQVRCFNGTGGASWSGGSLRGSSSLRLFG